MQGAWSPATEKASLKVMGQPHTVNRVTHPKFKRFTLGRLPNLASGAQTGSLPAYASPDT
jgi:hypothetical protein